VVSSTSHPHLLIVDDEPHIGLLLRPPLEHIGFRVSLAPTLALAQTALADRTLPVDGLLLDLHLRDGSGLDFLRELRATTAGHTLPVIVLTAEGEEGVLTEARRLGADLLTKPFSPSKLTARLAALFDREPLTPDATDTP
jgi:DNA-binding response OmpR family regulator